MRDIEEFKITYSTNATRYVRVGNGVVMPAKFTAVFAITDDLHGAMEVEVIDGAPRCVLLVLEDRTGAKAREVRLPMQRWLDQLAAAVGAVAEATPSGDTLIRPPGDKGERDAVRSAVSTKSRVTDAVLRRAAAAYEDNGIEGVRVVCHVSEATAYRYLKRARDKGFLPKRNKKMGRN